MDLSRVASSIRMGPERLWISPTVSEVSYPLEDSDVCFAVEEDSFWFAHRNQAIVSAARRFPPGGTIFDVGGGNGYVAKALQDGGSEVVLVEPSLQGARNARRRGIANIVQSTLKDAGFRRAVLPAVGFFDVIEHIEDDRAFLTEAHSYLAPGGRLYLTTPAFQWLWSQADLDARHWRRYTLSQICAVLEASGFAIEYATYFFGFLVLPIYLLRVLPFRLRVDSKKDVREKAEIEHRLTNPWLQRIIAWLGRREIRRLASGARIPLGASCLVVAEKPKRP